MDCMQQGEIDHATGHRPEPALLGYGPPVPRRSHKRLLRQIPRIAGTALLLAIIALGCSRTSSKEVCLDCLAVRSTTEYAFCGASLYRSNQPSASPIADLIAAHSPQPCGHRWMLDSGSTSWLIVTACGPFGQRAHYTQKFIGIPQSALEARVAEDPALLPRLRQAVANLDQPSEQEWMEQFFSDVIQDLIDARKRAGH